jgi:excisionase family DNA binding protein
MTVTQTSWTPTTAAASLRIPVQGQAPKQPPEPAERTTMLTIPEIAAVCQISPTSVRRAIVEGELEAVKLRSRIRITREAFDAWLANQQRPATRRKPRPAPPRPRASRPKKPPRVFPPPGSFRELSRAGLDQDAA